MALTGRAAAAALAGALIVLALRTVAALLAVDAVILAAIAADVILAAPVRSLRLTRSGDTRIRLGASRRGHADDRQPEPPGAARHRAGRLAAQRGRAASACGAERPGRWLRPA